MSVVSNVDAVLVVGVGQTVTVASNDQTNPYGRGVKVLVNTTAIGTGSITVNIQGKDPASGQYYTILASAAITTNVANVYTVYPGLASVANISANDVLPRTWRVNVVAGNANPANYTVAASVIV